VALTSESPGVHSFIVHDFDAHLFTPSSNRCQIVRTRLRTDPEGQVWESTDSPVEQRHANERVLVRQEMR
jgi:hypothetical protein